MRLAAPLLAVALAACAHAAPVSPADMPARAVLFGREGETEAQFFARILVDACSARPTDEVLIEHALLLLDGCVEHASLTACSRRACVKLGEDDKDGCNSTRRYRNWKAER